MDAANNSTALSLTDISCNLEDFAAAVDTAKQLCITAQSRPGEAGHCVHATQLILDALYDNIYAAVHQISAQARQEEQS